MQRLIQSSDVTIKHALLNNVLACLIEHRAFTTKEKFNSKQYDQYRVLKTFVTKGRVPKHIPAPPGSLIPETYQDLLDNYKQLFMFGWDDWVIRCVYAIHCAQTHASKVTFCGYPSVGIPEDGGPCTFKSFSEWIESKTPRTTKRGELLIQLEAVLFMAIIYECLFFGDRPLGDRPISKRVAIPKNLGRYRESLYAYRHPAGFSSYSVMKRMSLVEKNKGDFSASTLKRKMLGKHNYPFWESFFTHYLSIYMEKDPKMVPFITENKKRLVEGLAELWSWLYLLDHAANACIEAGISKKELIPVLGQYSCFQDWYQRVETLRPPKQ